MPEPLHQFFEWLLRSSWQAAVIVVLVLVVQLLLGRKLSPHWRHALWLLVIVRLMLPALPPSDVSVFNLQRLIVANEARPVSLSSPHELPANELPSPATPPKTTSRLSAPPPRLITEAEVAPPKAAMPRIMSSVVAGEAVAVRPPFNAWTAAAAVWLCVAIGLVVRIGAQNVRFVRRLRHARNCSDTEALAMLEECRRAMRVKTEVQLVEADHVQTPALYGWWRPRLLLPVGLTQRFSRGELHHIFLHELAHVKRQDMVLQWVVTGLTVLHWFNPVLWLAWRRMAADRELACDAMVLAHTGETAGEAYGQTIIKLLEQQHSASSAPTSVLGILETRSGIFRRIRMIAAFSKRRNSRMLGFAVLVLLALAGLTGAKEALKVAAPPPANASAPGRIVGRVVLDGPAPPERVITFDAPSATARGTNRAMTRHYVTDATGGLANVLVVIRDGARLLQPRRTEEVSLTITGALYEPYVIAVQTNQPLRLFNADSVLHNAHIQVPSNGNNRGKNIALPRQNHSTLLEFPHPDRFLTLKCDVHPWEYAYIAVHDHAFFAVTREDGGFELPPLPPGRYIVETHHPKAHSTTNEVIVAPGKTNQVEFKMSASTKYGLYAVESWPRAFDAISTLPQSNKLNITLWRDKEGDVRGTIKNDEEAEIFLYNVRIQVPSTGGGTDGFGWDTILMDYPWPVVMEFDHHPRRRFRYTETGRVPPGEVADFKIEEITPVAWRLCVLYQIKEKTVLQCEAISNVVQPSDQNPPATAEQAYRRIGLSMLRGEVEKMLGQPARVDEKGVSWYAYLPAAQTAEQRTAASAGEEIGIEWKPVHGTISKTLRRAGK